MTLFDHAIAAIDSANAEDPHNQALPYSQRMTDWLLRLYPHASEVLQLAARAQHLRRWQIPRNTYPMDKPGYHAWRTKLMQFHADQLAQLLSPLGHDNATISRIQSLLRKERLKSDFETQALEDTICLVFLQYEFPTFLHKHPEEKLFTILRRTWSKMSSIGHTAALTLLPNLPEDAQIILRRAGLRVGRD
jgi:hypothetical protein